MDQPTRPQVVIVGAGFGGLEAARALRRAPVDVVIVDQQNHHCFQPLLYQVATALLSPADVAWPIRSIVERQRNVRVVMDRVRGVDTEGRRVQGEQVALPYDYLVLATGATHSYFGHDGWAPFAPGLKRIFDATEIRRRFLTAFERAELTDDTAEQQRLLTFVIVGGGPTGVEMAGAMVEVARQTLQRDFRRIDPRTSRIVLIEAGPRLLTAFPKHLSDYAQQALERMGVEVRLSTMVTGCDQNGVTLGDARLDASTVVWAAGVVASPAAAWLGVEADRAGRIKVGPDLAVAERPNVFAIGDTALVLGKSGHPVPGVAGAAKQMGKYVGRLIAARVSGGSLPGPFGYHHTGDLATIGRKAAVVKLGRLELTGFLGWLFWSVVHIYFLIGLRNRLVVAATWLWSYLTYKRSARLISPPPRTGAA